MLTDKKLDEIEARLARATYGDTRGLGDLTSISLLADAVALLAEVRRLRLDNDLREDQWP